MNSLTCNHCRTRKVEGSEMVFHLTSCYHLFCSNCAPEPNAKCRVCAKHAQSVQIGPKMKPEIKSFFENRLQTSSNMLQALDFQVNLMQGAVVRLRKKIESYKAPIRDVASALPALKKMCDDGARRNKELEKAQDTLTEDVTRLRKEVETLKDDNLSVSIRLAANNKDRDMRPLEIEKEQFEDTMNFDLDVTMAPCPNTTVNVFTSKKSQYFQGPYAKRSIFFK